MRTFKILLLTTLAFMLVGVLCVTMDAWAGEVHRPAKDAQATLCVNPGGTGGCYASIQAAVDAADDYNTVRVAQGTYYETVVLTKSLILAGGWNGDFSARDWDTYVTTIDAQRNGPVIRVYAGISPTIEGFVITGGDDSAGLGWGGGIRVGESFKHVGLTVIRHNVITDNIACRTSSCQGEGGGIHVYNNTAIIEYNTIISNAARTGGNGGGTGGGVMIGWQGKATLTSNTIVSNTAVYTPTGLWNGKGGGVYVYSYGGVLTDNEIRGNVAAVDGTGRGGGVYAGGALYNNLILSNTATFSGTGYGGGVYALYVTDFDDNTVQGNIASQNGDGTGGGVWAQYLQKAYRNTIVDNVATRGGGIYYTIYTGKLTLRDNLITHNRATGSASTDGGGGISSAADWIEITNNRILSNTAAGGAGGGVLFTGGDRYVFRDNQIVSNTAIAGGGVAVYTATGSIESNHIISNLALVGGGMYVWGAAQPTLDSNVMLSNTASGFFAAGGGVLVSIDPHTPITLTNNIIARNAAGSGGPGGGVLCWQGDCVLINNTIVDNDRGDNDEGVVLGNSGYTTGIYTLTNNIIAGHSTGVWLYAGTATLDYNDYYDNSTDVSNTTWGAHHRTDDPQFEDRAGNDYHLTLTSPLVDQADGSAAPAHDFEGDPRPRGGGFDIGADEAYPAEVYVSANTGNDTTGSGTTASPFASVPKGLAEVRSGGTVYVARGQYTERITVTRGVDLLGGYNESDWSRDIAANVTTLDAQGTGTVVVIRGAGVEATVEGFVITGGEASIYDLGGGLFASDAEAVTVRYNTIHGNHAQNGGAGLFVDEGIESLIEANRIYDNVAGGVTASPGGLQSPAQGPEPGGGMLVGNPAHIVNNLIYNNSAAAGGDGVGLFAFGENTIQFLHNTVVDNGGTGGVGVQINGSAVEMYDNLIVGHGTAISGTQATWDYDGFYDNDADYGAGLSAGSHDVSGDPCFTDRAGRDYHIGPGSVGAGRGSDVGVTTDFDGASRPLPAGTAPDIGAYEVIQRRVYLPLVVRNAP